MELTSIIDILLSYSRESGLTHHSGHALLIELGRKSICCFKLGLVRTNQNLKFTLVVELMWPFDSLIDDGYKQLQKFSLLAMAPIISMEKVLAASPNGSENKSLVVSSKHPYSFTVFVPPEQNIQVS